MQYKHLAVGVLLVAGLGCDAPGPALANSAQAASGAVTVDQHFDPRDYSGVGGAPRVASFNPPPKGFARIDVPGVSVPPPSVSADGADLTLQRPVIRTGSATIEVDSLDRAVARARAMARALGGYLAGSSQHADRGRHESGAFEMRVPATALDDFLDSIKTLGRLEAVALSSTDVGEETVDVKARVENARWLERRLLELIATRTAKLKDVLDAERDLASVRGVVEGLQARQRYLETHAEMSSFTLSLHEPWPVEERHVATGTLARAVAQAWRNFMAVIAFGIAALGAVVPLALIASVGWVGWRTLHREPMSDEI